MRLNALSPLMLITCTWHICVVSNAVEVHNNLGKNAFMWYCDYSKLKIAAAVSVFEMV